MCGKRGAELFSCLFVRTLSVEILQFLLSQSDELAKRENLSDHSRHNYGEHRLGEGDFIEIGHITITSRIVVELSHSSLSDSFSPEPSHGSCIEGGCEATRDGLG